jgi:alpha-galactosidase
MLVVGKVGWGPTLRNTRLSPNEQLTHITLWSLLAAPMLIGCDLTQLDEFTLSLLTNPEILEVNQDVLGQQAQRISSRKSTEVWARSLSDGTQAVGLFNRGLTPATVEVSFEELRLSGVQAIRDLWQRSDLGVFQGSYSTTVPRHGAVFLKIGSPD